MQLFQLSFQIGDDWVICGGKYNPLILDGVLNVSWFQDIFPGACCCLTDALLYHPQFVSSLPEMVCESCAVLFEVCCV